MFFNPGSVSNSGQGIQGPRGPKGDKGDTGPQGPKGEKGDSGVIPSDMVDYIGNQHESLKAKNDADVEWLLDKIDSIQGEFNTVHYEGQYITAIDTLAGQAKNAILKGQTTGGVITLTASDYSFNGFINDTDNNFGTEGDFYPSSGDRSTDYIDISSLGDKFSIIFNVPLKGNNNLTKGYTHYSLYNENKNIIKGTTTKFYEEAKAKLDIDKTNFPTAKYIRISMNIVDDIDTVNGGTILQGELKSVNNPVLMTIGKNLFNYQGEDLNCYYSTNSGAEGNRAPHERVNSYMVEVLPNTTYTLSYKASSALGLSHISYWNENKVYITGEADKKDYRVRTITTPENCKYIRFPLGNTGVSEIQVEQGRQATSYEPYKLNVLTANEDVVLRGIGDMKDTLDISTGELTTRIGEVVLDGSSDEEYVQSGLSLNNTIAFGIVLYDIKPKGISINNRFTTTATADNNDYEHSYSSTHDSKSLVWFFINKRKLSSVSVSGFRQWLSQNPMTLQYELATPVIKRVDLSDNIVYSYNNITYYICSSAEGSLAPTLSFDVPTKLNALVSRQKDTIQELTQENESLKVAQQVLLNSQLSFYEALISAIPSFAPAEGQAYIPDFIQDLYKLKNNLK